MLIPKARATMLSLLVLLLASSLASATARAAAGPFWHYRFTEEGEGEKPRSIDWARFQDSGGEQKIKATVLGEPIEVVAPSVQVKGIYYNSDSLQGQLKITLAYNQPKLVKPGLKGCTVTVGKNNVTAIFGHLVWKWDGTTKQLEEGSPIQQKWDVLSTPKEIVEGTKGLPTGTLMTFGLSGSGCGVLAGKYPIEGSTVLESTPENLNEWVSVFVFKFTEGKKKQHFWNGTTANGVESGLTTEGNEANIVGQIKIGEPGFGTAEHTAVLEK